MNGLIIANGYERVHKFEEESCNLPNSPMFYPVLYDRVNIPFSWKYWCGNKVGSVVVGFSTTNVNIFPQPKLNPSNTFLYI